MQKEIKILKVKFNDTTIKKATEQAISWAKNREQQYITTPNPEFLLEARRNHKFRKVLNGSSLNIADGIGILWAAQYLRSIEYTKSKFIKTLKLIKSLLAIVFYPTYIKKALSQRVTGTDLMQSICEQAAKENLSIFLLGAEEGVAEKAKSKLEESCKGIQIVGTYSGSPKIEDERSIINKINIKSPNILFVAYGAPNQEFWIHRNLKKMPSVKLAIGIGGAFDFIAGKRKRAPKWMQKTGLEWLFRLIQEPSRIKRIYNATISFPHKVVKSSKY